MTKIYGSKFILASVAVLAFVLPASAETTSCRSQAEAAADQWADGRIVPVAAGDMAGSDGVTVISYGKKFVVPRNLKQEGSIITQELGSLATQRNQVYMEELERCLSPRHFHVTIISK